MWRNFDTEEVERAFYVASSRGIFEVPALYFKLFYSIFESVVILICASPISASSKMLIAIPCPRQVVFRACVTV